MRGLLQKVTEAAVRVSGEEIGRIGPGLLVFLGVLKGDTEEDAKWLAEKIGKLRLWDGSDGTINQRNVSEINGSLLVISQFTLAGDVSKGNRPDYTAAMEPAGAEKLYNLFIQHCHALGVPVAEGRFGASMEITLTNDGPVTLLVERP
ncbi:MAG TPA: D-aminoacyl-tRNA deacylase [Candidatus Peribacteraceae bacterium]|nr:D-aminoacyl-tRNA deacylase [Candidatus Peribacteraceae bacterium]